MWGLVEFVQQILCLLRNLLNLFMAGGVQLINLLLDMIGLLLKLVLLVLPDMPGMPSAVVDNQVVQGLNWFFPVGPFLAFATAALVVYVTFLIVRIAARWVKYL